MKYFIFAGLMLVSSVSWSAVYLRGQQNGKPVLIEQKKQDIHLLGEYLEADIHLKKCSSYAWVNFKNKIETLSKKSLPSTEANSISVEVKGKMKKISPRSPLGTYFSNITQHMLTFKKETELACAKK